VVLLGSGYLWWTFHNFSNNVPRLNVFAGGDKPADDIDGKDQNILIVGNDDRSTATATELKELNATRDGGSLNTDTMMIVHVPANGSRATLISLPRDSYVDIPGYRKYKLNAAYPDAYGATSGSLAAKRTAGAAELVKTVQQLTGLTVDHFVQVDLLGFYRISNAIGGVPVNMCAAVKEPNSGIDLHEGLNVIEGKQALAFVRQRYGFPNGLGDLDRVQRQRYFLTAAFRKLTTAGVLLNPFKLSHLLDAVQNSMYMDSQLDPIALARQLEGLSANNITGVTIPTQGFGFAESDGSSVVLVNPPAVQAYLKRLFAPVDSALSSAKPVAPSTVTLDVLNAGSGVDGAAATAADTLRAQGFTVGSVGNTAATSTTVIQYSDGQQAAAKTLGQYVPGATFQKTSGLENVRLLLGTDELLVKVPTAQPSSTSGSSSTAPPHPSTPAQKPIDSGCIN
jgi:LCP family protein required for cell wall assembly